MLINASNISKSFGAAEVFSGVSFSVSKGDKIGLVGANGAGKTTLMKMLMKSAAPDTGELHFSRELRVSYVEQHACSEGESTVYEEVLSVFAPLLAVEREMEDNRVLLEAGADKRLIQRQGELLERYVAENGYEFRGRTASCLKGLGFSEADFALPVSVLSGGQKTKILLAKMLLSGGNLLLLDEPTNNLDIASSVWLEEYLRAYQGAAVIISHDRYFLDRVTNITFSMECGALKAYPGNYSKFTLLREEDIKSRTRVYDNTVSEIERLTEAARKLHSFNREKSVKRAESMEKRIDRLSEGLEKVRTDTRALEFSFSPANRGGRIVLNVRDLRKAFGDKALFSGLGFELERGTKSFIIGANGCGKTTLLKILLGREGADGGEFSFGGGVDAAYYDQTGADLSPGNDVLNEVWDCYPEYNELEMRSALAAFLFRGDEVYKPVAALSGGERARLALLKIMLKRANLLVLDEPTNHLDIVSREALEAALAGYDGTVLCVSHDRYFINKLSGFVYDMDDGMKRYEGGYDDYLGRRAAVERLSVQAAAAAPKVTAYETRKAEESERRKATTALARAEAEVNRLEGLIAEKTELLYSEGVASDYLKADEVSREIAALEALLDAALVVWNDCSDRLKERTYHG